MEPIKGGKLADPEPEVKDILKSADSGASFASWAVRYAASLDGIITVLSGMSNIAQMKDNISYMKDFKPLSDAEQKVIRQVQRVLSGDKSIPCTACHYCTDGCPMNIPIPEIFALMNKKGSTAKDYAAVTEDRGKASDCVACGQCENACPQQLSVIQYLKECAERFEQ